MRLTHINSYYFTNRLHEALVRKLVDAGLEQHVFLPVDKVLQEDEPEVSGVRFSVLRCFSKIERVLWPLKMWRIWSAYKRSRTGHIAEIHHAHTLFVNGLIAYWAKKKYGVPYVVTIRNTDVNQFLKKHPRIFRPIGLKVMRESEAITTLSHVYWNQSIRSFYSDEIFEELSHKHHTIPNGCEDFWFENQHRRSALVDKISLVFVGLLGKNKNLSTLLLACRELQRRGLVFDLKVVGSGPLENELREQATDLPVEFLGYVSERTELCEIYRRSDVLVVPSFTESFGVVYAEAMTQGLPVIYTSGQGFDGFFSDGEVGFAVNPCSPEEVAERIVEIQNDYVGFADRVVSNAETFQWRYSVERLMSLYAQAKAVSG